MKAKIIGSLFGALLVGIMAGCQGCSLNRQIPKATICFNPQTRQIEINSHKDVVLSNVVANFQGTNATISIGYYQASSNIEVVKAAIQAQQQQIQGVQAGLEKIVGAAVSGATKP